MNLLTVDKVAIKLKVSRNTVVNLIKKGDIKALRVGGQYRIPEDNFNKFIKDSEIML